MKKLLAYLALALPLIAIGQSPISITQNEMPEPGDTLRYSNTFDPLIDWTSTGANHNWDYAYLQPESQDRDDYVYSLQTVYAFYFFGVNQYGTKVADTIGGGPFVFTNVYNFFRSASQDFRAEGVGFRYSGVPAAAYYSDEDELYQFPLDYLDRDSSTYRFSADLGNGTSFSQTGYRINEVDGWGTITTPYESIACLRLVSTTVGVDSVHFQGFHFGFPNQQRSVRFLALGVHQPILEISGRAQQGQQFQPQQVKYRDQYRNLVAVDNMVMEGIQVYPNPAMHVLTIDNLEQRAVEARLLDAKGAVVLLRETTLGLQQLDVSSLPAGIYLLNLHDGEGGLLHSSKVVLID